MIGLVAILMMRGVVALTGTLSAFSLTMVRSLNRTESPAVIALYYLQTRDKPRRNKWII